MYVCLCFGITDKHLKKAVQQGCCNYSEVRACTKVGMQCGKCACMAKQVVREEIASLPAPVLSSASLATPGLSPALHTSAQPQGTACA